MVKMKILSRTGLSGILKICLDIAFYAGIVLGVLLCAGVKYLHDRFWISSEWETFTPLYITFMVCGVIGLFITYEMRRIFRSIVAGQPFCSRNVTALRRIAGYGFGISAALAVMDVIELRMFTTLIALIFLIFGLFMIVLAEVFKQAVEYKLENDLTV